jgi:release factor glutamine methyltransferase
VTLLRDVIQQLEAPMAAADIPDARLEAEVMIMNVMRVPRHRIYAYQEEEVPEEAEKVLHELVERRLKREPLAYIMGHKEFYGVDLLVRPGVLIPRPETEGLVEQTLFASMMRMEEGSFVIAEPGTGCGAIAVSLAIHLPAAHIVAMDLYETPLRVAEVNVQRHNVADRVTLLQGDLLEPFPEQVDLVVANLPYIRSESIDTLQPEIQWEPREALDGGADGLELIRRLLQQAQTKLKPGGAILLEVDPQQVGPIEAEAATLFPSASCTVEKDLAGLDRVLTIDTSSDW